MCICTRACMRSCVAVCMYVCMYVCVGGCGVCMRMCVVVCYVLCVAVPTRCACVCVCVCACKTSYGMHYVVALCVSFVVRMLCPIEERRARRQARAYDDRLPRPAEICEWIRMFSYVCVERQITTFDRCIKLRRRSQRTHRHSHACSSRAAVDRRM